MNFKILWVAVTVGIFFNTAGADEKQMPAHRLADWEFGETLFGKPATTRSLKGKAVVIQYWGVGCSSCLKGLAHLKKLDEEYRGKGLATVGAEIYHSGKKEIGKVLKEHNVGFTITDGVKGPISVSGLPYAVVFAPDGKMVFHGHPNDERFEAGIRAATREVRAPNRVAIKVAEETIIPMRKWSDQNGRTMFAAVKKIEGNKVIFRMKNERVVPYELRNLSEQDQQFIKKTISEAKQSE